MVDPAIPDHAHVFQSRVRRGSHRRFGLLLVAGIAILCAAVCRRWCGGLLAGICTKNWLTNIIQTNINNLAGVPSIVYGMLGLAVFVRLLETLTSGAAFGVTDSNGRTVLSAGRP